MKNRLIRTLAFALGMATLAAPASATVFTKDYHGPGVWNSYDDQNQTYTMKFKDDGSKDGFWLVVSPGANPKQHMDEYAILYGDRAANRITAYTYDGQNSAGSFRTGDYLATYENAFSTAGGMTMFALDVSGINDAYDSAAWAGVGFGDQQGIWFHQSNGSNFAYDANGGITDYTYGGQMWVDNAFQNTQRRECTAATAHRYYCQDGDTPTRTGGGSVPAPGGLALVLLGLAGFGMRRRG